jgi:hypothetical protein
VLSPVPTGQNTAPRAGRPSSADMFLTFSVETAITLQQHLAAEPHVTLAD